MLCTGKKNWVSTNSHLNRISRGKFTKVELEAFLVRDSSNTNENCLAACWATPWQVAFLPCSGWPGPFLSNRAVQQKVAREREVDKIARLLCIPFSSNHSWSTLILLICEGITVSLFSWETQAFLFSSKCPVELMGSVLLKLISSGNLGLWLNKNYLHLKSVFYILSKHL